MIRSLYFDEFTQFSGNALFSGKSSPPLTVPIRITHRLMVYFGPPVAQDDHATRAVRCALAMQERLAGYNVAQERWAPLRMGIGIHTGPAVVGSIGASHRREYTAIGDTVNVAARIEQLCKPLNETILISGDTRSRSGDVAVYRSVSECSVRGRNAAVQVYSPLWNHSCEKPH